LPLHLHKACALAAWLLLSPGAGRAEPPPNVARPPEPPAMPSGPSDCVQRLKEVALFSPIPSIRGPGECGGEDLVNLEAVMMPDRSRVTINPPSLLRCSMAEAVAQFVRSDVGPAAAELGAPLAGIVNADAYGCRNRNRAQAAKISEHARANALDIGAVRLVNRTTHSLTAATVPKAFRERVREAACRYFTTVLGPGSDAYHSDHVHLDRAERGRGYRLCQWTVLEPHEVAADVPLPPPRPVALTREAPTEQAPGARQK
jgi:hypothetical protein